MSLAFGAATSDRVGAAGGLAAGQSYTILMWHFPTTITAGRRWFAYQTAIALHDVLWSFGPGTVFFDVPMASGSAAADSSRVYSTGKWWLNAFTYSDADGPRIYAGDLSTEATEDSYASRATTGTSIAGDVDTTIANITAASVAYQGSIAIFARFNRVLTLAEIRRWQFAPFVDADCVQFYELGYDGVLTQKNLANLGVSDGTVTGATLAAHVPILSWFRQPQPPPTIAVMGGVLFRDFRFPFAPETPKPPAIVTGITVALQTVLESDVVLALGRIKTLLVPTATETDSALGIGRIKSLALGLVSETDTVLALARAKQRALGLVSESDTVLALGKAKTRAVGLVTETDAALALGRIKTRALGIVSETDVTQAFGKAKTRALGLVSEFDQAMPIVRAGAVSAVKRLRMLMGVGQ